MAVYEIQELQEYIAQIEIIKKANESIMSSHISLKENLLRHNVERNMSLKMDRNKRNGNGSGDH